MLAIPHVICLQLHDDGLLVKSVCTRNSYATRGTQAVCARTERHGLFGEQQCVQLSLSPAAPPAACSHMVCVGRYHYKVYGTCSAAIQSQAVQSDAHANRASGAQNISKCTINPWYAWQYRHLGSIDTVLGNSSLDGIERV